MKITRAHADYWCARRAPAFIREAFKPKGKMSNNPVTVDQLINSQTESHWNLETLNTVALISGVRKHLRSDNPHYPEYASLKTYLEYLTRSESHKKRRCATARKWLLRLERTTK